VDIGQDDKFNTQSLISESLDEFFNSFLFLDNLVFNILLCLADLYIDLDNLSGLLSSSLIPAALASLASASSSESPSVICGTPCLKLPLGGFVFLQSPQFFLEFLHP